MDATKLFKGTRLRLSDHGADVLVRGHPASKFRRGIGGTFVGMAGRDRGEAEPNPNIIRVHVDGYAGPHGYHKSLWDINWDETLRAFGFEVYEIACGHFIFNPGFIAVEIHGGRDGFAVECSTEQQCFEEVHSYLETSGVAA